MLYLPATPVPTSTLHHGMATDRMDEGVPSSLSPECVSMAMASEPPSLPCLAEWKGDESAIVMGANASSWAPPQPANENNIMDIYADHVPEPSAFMLPAPSTFEKPLLDDPELMLDEQLELASRTFYATIHKFSQPQVGDNRRKQSYTFLENWFLHSMYSKSQQTLLGFPAVTPIVLLSGDDYMFTPPLVSQDEGFEQHEWDGETEFGFVNDYLAFDDSVVVMAAPPTETDDDEPAPDEPLLLDETAWMAHSRQSSQPSPTMASDSHHMWPSLIENGPHTVTIEENEVLSENETERYHHHQQEAVWLAPILSSDVDLHNMPNHAKSLEPLALESTDIAVPKKGRPRNQENACLLASLSLSHPKLPDIPELPELPILPNLHEPQEQPATLQPCPLPESWLAGLPLTITPRPAEPDILPPRTMVSTVSYQSLADMFDRNQPSLSSSMQSCPRTAYGTMPATLTSYSQASPSSSTSPQPAQPWWKRWASHWMTAPKRFASSVEQISDIAMAHAYGVESTHDEELGVNEPYHPPRPYTFPLLMALIYIGHILFLCADIVLINVLLGTGKNYPYPANLRHKQRVRTNVRTV